MAEPAGEEEAAEEGDFLLDQRNLNGGATKQTGTLQPLYQVVGRVVKWLGSPTPWNGSRPFRRYAQASLVVVSAILVWKLLTNADPRLEVYVVDVAVVFVLGFAVLEGAKAKDLLSAATRGDVALALVIVVFDIALQLGAGTSVGYQASPSLGFADAILLILVLFLALYGWRDVHAMAGPISLLLLFAAITQFISNENPAFYTYVGRYFIGFMVWISSGLLSAMGYSVSTGPDSFTILGSPGLSVGIGIRCAGLDVAALYALMIAYFAWGTTLSSARRILLVVLAALGTLVVNAARIVGLTILFMNYPINLMETVHTNIGDLVFLAYALPFIVILRRHSSA